MLPVMPPDSATYPQQASPTFASSPSGSLQRTHLLVYTFRTHGSSISFPTETVIVEFTSNLKCFTLLFLSYPSPVCPHFLVAPRAPSQVTHANIPDCTPHKLPICCCGAFWIPSCAVSMVFAHLAPNSRTILIPVPAPLLLPGSFLTRLLNPNESFSMPTISPASARHLKTHAKIDSYLDYG